MRHNAVYLGDHYFRDGEAFSVIQFPEPDRERMQLHTHDFVEICYVCSGSGYHVMNNRQVQVTQGDLFLIHYDTTHAFYRERDGELVTCNLLLRPELLEEPLLPYTRWDSNGLRLSAAEQFEFGQLIGKLNDEYTRRRPGYPLVIRAHMMELMVKIVRSLSERSEAAGSRQPAIGTLEPAMRYLNANYHRNLSLMELAQQAFVSKNYFCRLFKEATGETVWAYIRRRRIEHACRLMMADTNAPLIRIAHEVGYADYKAFYLAFKKATGCSPHQYKLLHSSRSR